MYNIIQDNGRKVRFWKYAQVNIALKGRSDEIEFK